MPDLVDLVEHEDRVDRGGLLHPLDDLAGEGADVRAPVTTNRGLVMDATEADAVELASDCARDRTAERGLTHTRWSDETQNRSLLVGLELSDGQVFDDALLDLLEAGVVLVEDLAHGRDVHVVGGLLAPGDVENPVDVGANDGVLRRANLHLPQALELLVRDVVGLARQVRLGQALFEDVEVALIAFLFAQLFLDGLELLAQDVLALVLAHLLFDLGVDAVPHFEDFELTREQAQDLANAFLRVERLEELRLLIDWGVEVCRHQVGELTVLLNRIDERAGLARQLRHELDDLLGNVAEAHRERFAFDVLGFGFVEARDAGANVRFGGHHLFETDSYEALENEAVIARAMLERFEDARRDADRIEVVLVRIVRRGVPLGDDRDDRLIEVLDVLDERDGLLAAHVKGRDGRWEQHRVPDRQNRELVAELDFARVGGRDRCDCFLFVAHAGVLLQLGQNRSFFSTVANIATHHFPGKGLTCGAREGRQGQGVT